MTLKDKLNIEELRRLHYQILEKLAKNQMDQKASAQQQQPNPNPPQMSQEKALERMTLSSFIISGLLLVVVLVLIGVIFYQRGLIAQPKDQSNPQAEKLTKPEVSPVPFYATSNADQDIYDSKLFINAQSVDIDNTFRQPADKIQLTINGPLKKRVFGFLPYWAFHKIDDIDIRLLTDISYFGLDTDANGNIIKNDAQGRLLPGWNTLERDPQFGKFLAKARKNKTKVHLTIKCFNQSDIVKLTASQEARENFINNAIYLLNSKSFDGINLDFEYIGTPSKAVTDGFSLLVIDLNKEMKRQYPNAELTIDTFVDAASATRINDVPVLAQNSDALVIMGYDFHTPGSAIVGPVAPFEGYGNSLSGLMSSYLEKAPAEKLILAVPYYGYDWPVINVNKNAAVVGGRADVRILSYAEASEISRGKQIFWDEDAKTPWFAYIDASKRTRVVHFENTRSLGIKYDYVNQKNLAGIGIWALGFDGLKKDLEQLIADKFSKK